MTSPANLKEGDIVLGRKSVQKRGFFSTWTEEYEGRWRVLRAHKTMVLAEYIDKWEKPPNEMVSAYHHQEWLSKDNIYELLPAEEAD